MNRKMILIPIIVIVCIIVFFVIVLNLGHKLNKFAISENVWNSIKESRIENENLVLEDIEFNDYKLIIDEKNNSLYYSLVNDSKNKYNPNINYKANNKNVKLAFLDENITDEKVKNNYNFKIMIYNEKEYHIYNLKCTDLPLLNIRCDEEIEINKKNIPIEIYLFNNLSDASNRITVSKGKLKINEKGYMFSLQMISPGKNRRDFNISILNMRPNSEYILKPVSDITEGNELKEVNSENKSNKVELFINNEYKGTYFLESINKDKNFKNK